MSIVSMALPQKPDDLDKEVFKKSFLQRRERYINMQRNIFQGRIIKMKAEEIYKIGYELGAGSYGTVRIAHKRSYKHKKFALKSIHVDKV
jgi:hypothetical protein